jgi:hypothetical protein
LANGVALSSFSGRDRFMDEFECESGPATLFETGVLVWFWALDDATIVLTSLTNGRGVLAMLDALLLILIEGVRPAVSGRFISGGCTDGGRLATAVVAAGIGGDFGFVL